MAVRAQRANLATVTMAAVVAGTMLIGCSSNGSPTGSSAGSPSSKVESVVRSAGIDPNAALASLCDAWALGHPDSPTVNQYVWDLLAPLELVNGADPPAFGSDEIDAAVQRGCEAHRGDPGAFLDAVLADLRLTRAELAERIVLACARYRVEQRRIAQGDWSGKDLDPAVLDVAGKAGVAEAQVRTAIEVICA